MPDYSRLGQMRLDLSYENVKCYAGPIYHIDEKGETKLVSKNSNSSLLLVHPDAFPRFGGLGVYIVRYLKVSIIMT